MTTTNEDTQRDELAQLIAYEADRRCGFTASYPPPAQQDRELADAILAAGFRKPRAITTVEELDALPEGSAILCSNRGVWVNDGDTVAPWASLGEGNSEGGPIWVHSVDITLPATVLHEPEAEVEA